MNCRLSAVVACCCISWAADAQAIDATTVWTSLQSEPSIAKICAEYAARQRIYSDVAAGLARQREELAFAIAQNNVPEQQRVEKQVGALSARLALARNSVDAYSLQPVLEDIALRDGSEYVQFYLKDRHAPPPSASQVLIVPTAVARVGVDIPGAKGDIGADTSNLAIDVRFRSTDIRQGQPSDWTFVPVARLDGNAGALCSALSSRATMAELQVEFTVAWPRLAAHPIRYVVSAGGNAGHIQRNDAAGRRLLFDGLSGFLERMLVDRSYRLVQDVSFRDQPSLVAMRAIDPEDRVGGPRRLTPTGPGQPTVYEYQTLFDVFDGVADEFGAASVMLTKSDLIALRADLDRAMRLDGHTLVLTWAKGGQSIELCFKRENDGLRLTCVRTNGAMKWPSNRKVP